MARDKIAVAMSGGVDSSVVAYMLKEQGYDIIGITMIISNKNDSEKEKKTVNDAKLVAEFLNIEHHIIDLKHEFYETVISQFLNEYPKGRTPNPCVTCNKYIKFGALLNKAHEMGCSKIATGHYVKKEYDKVSGEYSLYRADDSSKDQTYMMYNLKQQTLEKILFPLGTLSKSEVRKIAENSNLPVAFNSESQEICFIDDNDYKRFWKENSNKKPKRGNLIDSNGTIIGEHEGIQNYTIGQRKGLGVALGFPAYVTKIDAKTHNVTIGENSLLFSDILVAKDVNWLSGKSPENKELLVKIRYRSNPEPASIVFEDKNIIKIKFNDPQRAITPGQSAVFYEGDKLLGGGVIN